MAETDPATPDLEDRVESLETGQSKILSKLDEILGISGKPHKAAEQREEQHLDRPTTVQEQVRAELARADAERKAQADADAEKSEQQTMRETLAKLTEAKPAQPQPRRQRTMWGKQ
jgi:hypothetical protein